MRSAVTTVFVHGVGMWPGTFGPVASGVPGAHRLWVRPGYDGTAGSSPFGDQVRALTAVVAEWGPVRLVGVSGGATLALACAIAAPPGLVGIVTHEPLVGPLVPELHARVAEAGERLRRGPGPRAARAFLLSLYGSRSWLRLPPAGREWAEHHHNTVCREVGYFASFEPSRADLAGLAVPHVTTVGADSGPERHRVAHLLAELGTTTVTLVGCGHLAPVDAPDGLTRAVIDAGRADRTADGGGVGP